MGTRTRRVTVKVGIDSLKIGKAGIAQPIVFENVEVKITIAGRQVILQVGARETPLAGNIVLQRWSADNILQMLTHHLADPSANRSAERAWISRQRAAGHILGLIEDMLTEIAQEHGSQVGTDGPQPLQLSQPRTGTSSYKVYVRTSK